MKRVAIGIRVHSGWGALVAVTESTAPIEIVERARIAITDSKIRGASQPYHFAKAQKLEEAERYLDRCAAVSQRLACDALGGIVAELRRREYDIAGCAIILASGRALPALSQILGSHSLIHTAEGEFFRRAFSRAIEQLEIPVTGIRERDLEERARQIFGDRAVGMQEEIAGLGKSLGPPWTADQKTACLSGLLVLAGGRLLARMAAAGDPETRVRSKIRRGTVVQ